MGNLLERSTSTTRWELCGSILIVVHSDSSPSDSEFIDLLNAHAAHIDRFDAILVHSGGGGPKTMQRKRMIEFWQGRQAPKTAIMTSSISALGAATALNWFLNKPLKAFGPKNFEGAFDYLDVAPGKRQVTRSTVNRLRAQFERRSAL